jgi:hypothetical protein
MVYARLELVVFGATDVFVTVGFVRTRLFFLVNEVRKGDINGATLTLAR